MGQIRGHRGLSDRATPPVCGPLSMVSHFLDTFAQRAGFLRRIPPGQMVRQGREDSQTGEDRLTEEYLKECLNGGIMEG